MKGYWLIFVVSVAVLFAVEVTGRRKGRRYVSPEEMLDADDKREFFKNETSVLNEIDAREMQRSILNFKAPECDFSNWTTPSCFMEVEILKRTFRIEANVILNLKRLSIYAALLVDDFTLIDAEFLLSKICLRFPPFPKLAICGHIYYFDCNFGSPLFVETCLTILVADLIELRFYCLKLEKGELSRTDEIEPEDKGPFAVVFKKDRVIFEFNTAIPEMLVHLLGAAVQFITDAIIMVVNVVKAAVTSMIDTITNWFSPRPRLR